MATADHNTRNGFSPRPGIVHRPTRSSLPPLVSAAATPGIDYGHVHGPAREHWTDTMVSQAVRIPTAGAFSPVPDPLPTVRIARILDGAGHIGAHVNGDHSHGSHVTAIHPDGTVEIADWVKPDVSASILRMVESVR